MCKNVQKCAKPREKPTLDATYCKRHTEPIKGQNWHGKGWFDALVAIFTPFPPPVANPPFPSIRPSTIDPTYLLK